MDPQSERTTDQDIAAAISILMTDRSVSRRQAVDLLWAEGRHAGTGLADVAARVAHTGRLDDRRSVVAGAG